VSVTEGADTSVKSTAPHISCPKSPLMQSTLKQLQAARRFNNGCLDSLNAKIALNDDAEEGALLFRKWRHSYERLVRLERILEKRQARKEMCIKRFHEMSTKEWMAGNGPKHVSISIRTSLVEAVGQGVWGD
jgi:hypothetical protein